MISMCDLLGMACYCDKELEKLALAKDEDEMIVFLELTSADTAGRRNEYLMEATLLAICSGDVSRAEAAAECLTQECSANSIKSAMENTRTRALPIYYRTLQGKQELFEMIDSMDTEVA